MIFPTQNKTKHNYEIHIPLQTDGIHNIWQQAESSAVSRVFFTLSKHLMPLIPGNSLFQVINFNKYFLSAYYVPIIVGTIIAVLSNRIVETMGVFCLHSLRQEPLAHVSI